MTDNQKIELDLLIRVSAMPKDMAQALHELVREIEKSAIRARIDTIKKELALSDWTV